MFRRICLILILTAACLAVAAPAASAQSFAPGAPGIGDPYFPLEGNGGYDVRHYDLSFSYDPATDRLDALNKITATATQNLSRFDLDFQQLTVKGVDVNDNAATFTRDGQELVITPSRGDRGWLHVYRERALRRRARDDRGVTDRVRLALWLHPHQRRRLHGRRAERDVDMDPAERPSKRQGDLDVPRDRPRRPRGGRERAARQAVAVGRKSTWVWDEPYPMSNYLATADIGQWIFKNGTTPGGIAETVALDPTLLTINPGAMDYFFDTTAEATDLWNDTFGTYPFDSTGAIADNATYNGQTIGFSLETQTRPLYSGIRSTGTIAHELAHQWFGDAVAVRTWNHIWLNEGFATFAQYLWDEHRGVRTAHEDFLLDYSRPASSSFWQIIVADPQRDTMFANAVYRRGAMTLQALREKIGDGPFFQILRTWVAEHLHGTATTEEFMALSERISGQDLSNFFQVWLYTAGKPTTW